MSARRLRIGITCYPTTGGSGIIATEIGLAMARRGHHVHFISYDAPGRLGKLPSWEHAVSLDTGSVALHRVELSDYPLPNLSPYPLALASRLAEVSRTEDLDLLHLHYAIPHAVSAYLARQLLLSELTLESGSNQRTPRTIITLHGTDITRVGSEPSFKRLTRFALLNSDGLTVPSEFLKRTAYESLDLPASIPIEVIPNFVDTERFAPAEQPEHQREPGAPWVLVHSSNFRPLKRIDDTVSILAGVKKRVPAVLWLVGDGPDRPRIEQLVLEQGLTGAVRFLGMQEDLGALLKRGDVFLLPSDTEGFGLAALEALSCGVPVVASRVGGVPEVVTEGETGLLCEPGDVEGMTAAVLRLLLDKELYQKMSLAARLQVTERWQQDPMVSRYEAYYRRILANGSASQRGLS